MIVFVTLILTRGTGQSKFVNNCLVCVKLIVIFLFILISFQDVNPANWHPFFPYGVKGVITGAATVFFSFLGFDALATSAEDARNVQHTIPRAIIVSLVISTILYIVVGLLLTGAVNYKKLDVPEAMAFVLLTHNHKVVAQIVAAGAILGIVSVVYAFIYAGSNIMKAMGRGGFLPRSWSQVNQQTSSPNRALWIIGLLSAVLAGEFDLHYLALIANVGSLTVFLLISLTVILLRKQYPKLKRPFMIPGGETVPLLSILVCGGLLVNITSEAWLSYLGWLGCGLLIYAVYSRHHVDINQKIK